MHAIMVAATATGAQARPQTTSNEEAPAQAAAPCTCGADRGCTARRRTPGRTRRARDAASEMHLPAFLLAVVRAKA